MKQPLAFRLAKRLERQRGDIGHAVLMLHSADELRRLHEVNLELMEAIEDLAAFLGECGATEKARDAIANATGETG
tara:strand:+ start:2995 stop:3222 length:228 start_codon:yes stop_codon:yes gene_type:complete